MPRTARIYTEEGVFHLLTRGNNRQWIFHEEEDFQNYRDLLKKIKEEQPYKLYHYCLMNNHVHLIIETNDGDSSVKINETYKPELL
ncbi:MAG: transposase [bacterium]